MSVSVPNLWNEALTWGREMNLRGHEIVIRAGNKKKQKSTRVHKWTLPCIQE